MGNKVIGTCSICSGMVCVPDVWFGVVPPVPTCCSCNARAKGFGPVIPMERSPVPDKIDKEKFGYFSHS